MNCVVCLFASAPLLILKIVWHWYVQCKGQHWHHLCSFTSLWLHLHVCLLEAM